MKRKLDVKAIILLILSTILLILGIIAIVLLSKTSKEIDKNKINNEVSMVRLF